MMKYSVGKLLDILETERVNNYLKSVSVSLEDGSTYRRVEIYRKDDFVFSFYQVRCGNFWFSTNPHNIYVDPNSLILINGRITSKVGEIFSGYFARSEREIIRDINIDMFSHFDDPGKVYNIVKSKMDKYYLHRIDRNKVLLVRKSDYKVLVLHFSDVRYQILRGLHNLLSSGKNSISDINTGFASIILGYIRKCGIIDDSVRSISDLGIESIRSLVDLILSVEAEED